MLGRLVSTAGRAAVRGSGKQVLQRALPSTRSAAATPSAFCRALSSSAQDAANPASPEADAPPTAGLTDEEKQLFRLYNAEELKEIEADKAAWESIPGPFNYLRKKNLDTWKFYLPASVVLAIPAITLPIFKIDEEAQLACCFAMFVGLAYHNTSKGVAQYFADKREAMLKEFNASEEAAIEKHMDDAKKFEAQTEAEKLADLEEKWRVDVAVMEHKIKCAKELRAHYDDMSRTLTMEKMKVYSTFRELQADQVGKASDYFNLSLDKKDTRAAIMDDAISVLAGGKTKNQIMKLCEAGMKDAAKNHAMNNKQYMEHLVKLGIATPAHVKAAKA